jgi:hypothetical protein
VWGSKSGHLNRGAAITDNAFIGDNFGFGIAVDGVVDFTIEGNRATGRFGGVRTKRCWPSTSPPGHAFVRNSQSSSGTFQSDFEEGVLGYAICIKKSAEDPD